MRIGFDLMIEETVAKSALVTVAQIVFGKGISSKVCWLSHVRYDEDVQFKSLTNDQTILLLAGPYFAICSSSNV